MKNRSGFAVGVLFFLVMCLNSQCNVFAQEQLPEFKDWVSDYANIMTPDYKTKLNSLIDDLRVKTSTEIAVVVTPSTGSYGEVKYTESLLKKWDLGKRDNRGLVFVLVVSNNRWTWRIQTGVGLKDVLTNALISQIGNDQMAPYFNEQKYAEGLYYAVAAMANAIDQGQDVRIKEIIENIKSDIKAGLYDKAIEHTNKVLELDPYFSDAYWTRAGIYVVKENYDQALFDYDKGLQLNPNSAEAYTGRGALYDLRGNYDNSISDLTKAITINPKYSQAYRNRASTYDKKGNYSPALADINKAIELDPKMSAFYNARSIIYFHLAQYQESWNDAVKANDLGYKVDPLYVEDLKKALKQEFFDSANKAFTAGKLDEAISYLNNVLQISPRSSEAYNLLASMNAMKGNLAVAITDYTKAIEINPKDDNAYSNRAATYYSQKDYQRAWQDVHQVEELGAKVNPKFIETLKKDSGREK